MIGFYNLGNQNTCNKPFWNILTPAQPYAFFRYSTHRPTSHLNQKFQQNHRYIINQTPLEVQQKIRMMKGENLKKHRVTLARSISPYAKKIIIRYYSPKRIYDRLEQEHFPQQRLNANNQEKIPLNKNNQKILDIKESQQPQQKQLKICFKSVKPASHRLFPSTPSRELATEKKFRHGSTDQTGSLKSLSKVSIDQRAFQE